MLRKTCVLLGLLAFVVGPPALAEEGRIPIFEPVVLDGNSADISGKYVLTRDITSATGNTIHLIGTGVEDIEIDLNGFTLTAKFTAILAEDLRSFVVRNGFMVSTGTPNKLVLVRSFIQGTDRNAVVEDLQLYNGWIEVQNYTDYRIRRNFVDGSSGVFVHNSTFDNSSGVIEDNRFISTAFGILIGPTSGSALTSQGLIVRNNRFIGGDLIIQEVSALILDGNTATESSGFHLRDVSGCRVTNNVVTEGQTIFNDIVGIKLEDSANCILEGNVANKNDYEIYLHDSVRTQLRDNQTSDNDEFGLFIDAGSTGTLLQGNVSRGNLGTSAVCGSPGIATCGAPDLCDFIGGSAGDNFVPGPPPC